MSIPRDLIEFIQLIAEELEKHKRNLTEFRRVKSKQWKRVSVVQSPDAIRRNIQCLAASRRRNKSKREKQEKASDPEPPKEQKKNQKKNYLTNPPQKEKKRT